MNPFSNTMPIVKLPFLTARDEQVAWVREKVCEKKHFCVQGVEGVGKTSLLNCALNGSFRKKMAAEGVLISEVIAYSDALQGDEIYDFFTEAVRSTCKLLGSDVYEALPSSGTGKGGFEAVVNAVKGAGYDLVLVIDNFEKFLLSQKVIIAHHTALRDVAKIVKYVVASNIGLNRNALPEGISSSLLLQLLTDSLVLGGWENREDVQNYVNTMSGPSFALEDAVADSVLDVSGGIPEIVRQMCELAWENRRSGSTEPLKFNVLYESDKMRSLLKHWARDLSPAQVEALLRLANNDDKSEDRENIFPDLSNRALLKKDHCFACIYFAMLCKKDPELLREWAEENPLRTDWTKTYREKFESLKQTISDLKENIAQGYFEPEEIIEQANALANFPDATRIVKIDRPLLEEELKPYGLTEQMLNTLNQDVRDFIKYGIRAAQCYQHVNDPSFDYSGVFVYFCKAVEAHLNHTLFPVFAVKIPGERVRDKNGTERTIGSIASSNFPGLMLGGMAYAIKNHVFANNNTRDSLKAVWSGTSFAVGWWQECFRIVSVVTEIRNNVPHSGLLEDSCGVTLVRELFAKNQHLGNTSFMDACIALRAEICGH